MDSRTVRQRVLSTLEEMFETRGYDSLEPFKDGDYSGLRGSELIVLFPVETSFRLKDCTYLFTQMEEHKIKHAIVIYIEKITPQTNALISQQMPDSFRLELFKENTLLFNPCRHRLVPPHIKVEASELDLITASGKTLPAKIKPEDLPPLAHYDPIVKFKGYRPGDIIRIDRVGTTPTYKIVTTIQPKKIKVKKAKEKD
jgi:DNA-directed RNA polymerase subunit H (RpoH/RPB5)